MGQFQAYQIEQSQVVVFAINKYGDLRSRLGILNIKRADLTTNDQQKIAEIWIQHDTTRKINGCVLGRSTASLNSWIMLNLYC